MSKNAVRIICLVIAAILILSIAATSIIAIIG